MTGPLRRALAAAGYDGHGWGLGRNRGLRPGVLDRLDAKVADLARNGPIIIVGWSLGGLYAREIAKRRPHDVARVVTLGSPFSGDIRANRARSEEHTSELQSLMRISYAVFCLQKKKQN